MRARLAVTILSMSLLVGWTRALPEVGHIPVPNAAKSNLGSTDVVLGIQQTEVYAFVSEDAGNLVNEALLDDAPLGTRYGGGGLIGSARTANAHAALAPLRGALSGYNLDDDLKRALAASLSSVVWLHPNGITVVRDTSNSHLNSAFASSKADAVLFIFPDYRLNNDCDYLFVQFFVRLVPKSDALLALRTGHPDIDAELVDQSKAIYGNLFAFVTRVSPTGDRQRNVAEWSNNQGAAMKLALKLAADKLAIMLIDDLARSQDDVAPASDAPTTKIQVAPNETWLYAGNGIAEMAGSGVLVGRDADGETVRYRDGSLAYFTTAAAETPRN